MDSGRRNPHSGAGSGEKRGPLWQISQGWYFFYTCPISRLILVDYQPTRSRAGPTEMLEGFRGELQTDGYAVYHQFGKIDGIELFACWAHARRKSKDALRAEGENSPQAEQAVCGGGRSPRAGGRRCGAGAGVPRAVGAHPAGAGSTPARTHRGRGHLLVQSRAIHAGAMGSPDRLHPQWTRGDGQQSRGEPGSSHCTGT